MSTFSPRCCMSSLSIWWFLVFIDAVYHFHSFKRHVDVFCIPYFTYSFVRITARPVILFPKEFSHFYKRLRVVISSSFILRWFIEGAALSFVTPSSTNPHPIAIYENEALTISMKHIFSSFAGS